MNRSTDILVQIQQIRLDRKKPKIPNMLKRTHFSENQKSEYASQQSKTHPIAPKKIGARNLFALTFAIGLHVLLAILVGIFGIADRMINENDMLRLEFLILKPIRHEPPPPGPHGNIGDAHPQAVWIQQEPVPITPDLQQTQDTFMMSDSDILTVGMSENLAGNRAKPFETRQNVSRSLQQNILKLTSVLIIGKPTSRNTAFDKLTQTEPDQGPGTLYQLDVVGTETIPQQITPISKPTYPKMARSLKKEGTVILHTIIDTDGIPKEIKVLTNHGYGLEEAAVESLKKSRYIPAKKNGIAIARSVEIQFEFKIQE